MSLIFHYNHVNEELTNIFIIDELVGFDQEWKCNANKHLPGWNIRHNYNAGSTGNRDSPFREGFGLDAMARPSGAIQKKVVTINIE